MTKEEYNKIINNQILITPEKASRLMSRIIRDECIKLITGSISNNNRDVEVIFKKNRREVQLHERESYTYFINPRYRKEYKHVVGIEDLFDGYSEVDGDKYYIKNYKEGYASIYKLK